MDSFYEEHYYTITENYKNNVRIKYSKGKVHIRNKEHAKQYFQKSSNHNPLVSVPPPKDIIESNHNNMGNDFITLFVEEPYETNNTEADETMSTQSDETTPYMLDSEQESDYNDDFSAGTDSADQQMSYTTKSVRATKILEHLQNFGQHLQNFGPALDSIMFCYR